jgi:PBSX family phage terminase large subunit
MASTKRSQIQIERDRQEIADLYLQGWTQARIADHINSNPDREYELSQQMISYDLQRLQEAWRDSALIDINKAKARELAKIDRLEREYWSAWLSSQKDEKTTVDEKHLSGSVPDSLARRRKVQETLKERDGNHNFLRGVQWCIEKRCEILGLDVSVDQDDVGGETQDVKIELPASAIAPSFYEPYRDIRTHGHTEYIFKGGRGSTKSSFVSLDIIELLVNNPDWHALAARQVANTLRDSVYAQLVWAINYLGLADKFKCTTSPLEIVYKPTGQTIYFRGGDDPLKIKSIKPKFGYINILWFEELDQFHGEKAVRSIEQSAIRGGDQAYKFKSFNPPPQVSSWVTKWLKVPDPNRYVHESDYRTVPKEWLGQSFIDMAEHLKEVNPKAYQHEYLGQPTELGGLVFPNVVIRKITDEEISQFDHLLHGLDWGYFPDPNSYGRMHFDAARMKLYIFGEYRSQKQSNRQIYDGIVAAGYDPRQLLIYDSAEPKSGADLRSFGANAKGAEKGPESVRYGIKWLQSLVEIVIDDTRAPYHAEEFLNYELEQDKDGNYISEFPDKNNHAIDDTRYATNLYWRRAGS